MKAAVFREAGKPLTIEEIPTPSPGPGEALVRVAGCGMCHTDLHYMDHGVKPFKTPPLVLGHEIAGTVAGVGAGVTGRASGDRVVIPSVFGCGRCEFCRHGRENLCVEMVMLGNNIDAGYAEYVVVPARELVPEPDSLSLERHASSRTRFHAVPWVRNRARVRPGETVRWWMRRGGPQRRAVRGGRGRPRRRARLNDARLASPPVSARSYAQPEHRGAPDKKVRELTGGGAEVVFEAIATEDHGARLRCCARAVGCVIGYTHEPMTLGGAADVLRARGDGQPGCGAGEYPGHPGARGRGAAHAGPHRERHHPAREHGEGFDRLRRGEGVRWVAVP
jgi:threonine dehydrogenase-like Zn-dependent dehydrogenase